MLNNDGKIIKFDWKVIINVILYIIRNVYRF